MQLDLLEKGQTREATRVEDTIKWRKERMSPPRCLSCGSTAVERLIGEYRHPGCGGELTVAEGPAHGNPVYAYLIPAEGPSERSWFGVW